MTLLKTNVDVISDIMENIVRYTREAIIINAANPLDILTYVMQKKFNYDPAKIIGTGTLLDTARFNKIIGDICRVDSKKRYRLRSRRARLHRFHTLELR